MRVSMWGEMENVWLLPDPGFPQCCIKYSKLCAFPAVGTVFLLLPVTSVPRGGKGLVTVFRVNKQTETFDFFSFVLLSLFLDNKMHLTAFLYTIKQRSISDPRLILFINVFEF